MNLDGRAALITGGARMGEAIAADAGGSAASMWRSCTAPRRNRPSAPPTPCAPAAVARTRCAPIWPIRSTASATVSEVAATFGRLDVVVNMASMYQRVPFDELDAGQWDRQLAVDLRAAFLISMAAVPHMRAAGGGRIVNFTDWVAASGRPRYQGFLPYYVAKAGVKALTEALALELARRPASS